MNTQVELVLTATDQAYFRALLTDQLNRLLAQANQAAAELAATDGRVIETIDRASVHADQEMKLRIRSRESRLINKVRLALDRLDLGIYGLCEICEEPISLERLAARPVTSKCIQCKEREERMEALSW